MRRWSRLHTIRIKRAPSSPTVKAANADTMPIDERSPREKIRTIRGVRAMLLGKTVGRDGTVSLLNEWSAVRLRYPRTAVQPRLSPEWRWPEARLSRTMKCYEDCGTNL